MTPKILDVSAWGVAVGRLGLVPGAFRVRRTGSDFTDVAAVVRSVERRTRLRVCGGPCSQGTALDGRGHSTAHQYSMTLGRPCRTGGYSVVAELWVSIKL